MKQGEAVYFSCAFLRFWTFFYLRETKRLISFRIISTFQTLRTFMLSFCVYQNTFTEPFHLFHYLYLELLTFSLFFIVPFYYLISLSFAIISIVVVDDYSHVLFSRPPQHKNCLSASVNMPIGTFRLFWYKFYYSPLPNRLIILITDTRKTPVWEKVLSSCHYLTRPSRALQFSLMNIYIITYELSLWDHSSR